MARVGRLEVIRLPGLVPYREAYTRQMAEHAAVLAEARPVAKLLLLEHAPVYTLGRMTKPEHVTGLTSSSTQPSPSAEVVESDRGGSVTWHGPGQLTAYLILDLRRWEMDLHRHIWNLEEAAIRTAAALGVKGERVEGMTGAWVDILDFRLPIADLSAQSKVENRQSKMAKLCAIGVGCRRWVTYHGLSLNVDSDLSAFDRIDPCGLGRKPVTSLAKLVGRAVPISDAEAKLVEALCGLLL